MIIKDIPVDELIPYARNPRKNDKAVDAVAASIKEFGFKVPCVVDRDNVLVTGHTRVKAAKKLGLKTVPCVVATDLTDEQVRAFRLADNKVGELADWDWELLAEEALAVADIDLEEFGFEFDDFDWDTKHEEYKENTEHLKQNVLNLETALYTGMGKYGIPDLAPVTELPQIREWIGFNYVMTDNDPEGKAVHFFIDDYQFERVWNNPDAYIERLRRYACVTAPDFSLFTDMPLATQIFNHYRKHWCARYWQDHGITVIPTLAWSLPESYEFCFEGEPTHSIVAVSTVGVMTNKESKEIWTDGMNRALKELKPSMVIEYGTPIDYEFGCDSMLIGKREFGSGRTR